MILPQAFRGSDRPARQRAHRADQELDRRRRRVGVAEASGLMKTMIEFRPDVIVAIFLTFALGFVILVVPVGLLTTALSRRLAVVR